MFKCPKTKGLISTTPTAAIHPSIHHSRSTLAAIVFIAYGSCKSPLLSHQTRRKKNCPEVPQTLHFLTILTLDHSTNLRIPRTQEPNKHWLPGWVHPPMDQASTYHVGGLRVHDAARVQPLGICCPQQIPRWNGTGTRRSERT